MREKSAVLVARHRPVDRTLLVLAALAIAAAVASSVSFRAASPPAPGGPSVVDEPRTTTPEGMETAPARGPAEAAPATGTANDAPHPALVLPQRDGAPQPDAAPGTSAGTADPAGQRPRLEGRDRAAGARDRRIAVHGPAASTRPEARAAPVTSEVPACAGTSKAPLAALALSRRHRPPRLRGRCEPARRTYRARRCARRPRSREPRCCRRSGQPWSRCSHRSSDECCLRSCTSPW